MPLKRKSELSWKISKAQTMDVLVLSGLKALQHRFEPCLKGSSAHFALVCLHPGSARKNGHCRTIHPTDMVPSTDNHWTGRISPVAITGTLHFGDLIRNFR